MATYDVDRARQGLMRLDLAVHGPIRPPLAAYCAFYGLDLEREQPDLRHYLGSFQAAGYDLACHVFLPAAAKGTLFVFHGYFDHAGLYAHLIRQAVGAGFAVLVYDLPGHGLSSGERAAIYDFEAYQDVLSECLSLYGGQLPKPFLALGQSTGAGVLMDYFLGAAKRHQSPVFKELVLLAPLVRPAHYFKVCLSHSLMRLLLPSVPRTFRVNSSDPAFIQFVHYDDPLQPRRLPAVWVTALREWVRRMNRYGEHPVPGVVLQGHRDETVDWRYNLNWVRRHFPNMVVEQVPPASHHLANERADIRAPVHEALGAMLARY